MKIEIEISRKEEMVILRGKVTGINVKDHRHEIRLFCI